MAYKGPQEVVGPASATDETLPRFDLATGALVQGSGVTVDDSDVMGGITQLNVDNLRLDGNTVSSTDTNGDVVITPDGTGTVSVTTAPIVPTGDRADSLGSATNSWDNVYADGITFDDGTSILDSYLEPTAWTPQLEFGGGSVSMTGTFTGYYSRIGNLALVNIRILLTARGSSTGNATITGFPLTSTASINQSMPVPLWQKITFDTGQTGLCANIAASDSTFTLYEAGTNTSFAILTNTNFSNDANVLCTFMMQVT